MARSLANFRIGRFRKHKRAIVQLRFIALDLRLQTRNLQPELLDVSGRKCRVERRQKLPLLDFIALMNVDAFYDGRIKRLKDIDPLSGDQLARHAGHHAVNLGQEHEGDNAHKKAGQHKHGNPRPWRLGRLADGVHFRLKLPDDTER